MSSASPAMLDADVVVERPGFRLQAALTAPAGSITAVIGPNGAGKSTLLDALCGLVPITSGQIHLGDRTLDDAATGIHVEPGQRGVAVSFQDALLFDGLDVLDNVGFGLRAAGSSRKDARRRAQALLDDLGLGDRAGDRPRTLSGGQAARVSLARALAVEPQLVLLDEPLSSLDASARAEIRPWLRQVLARRGVTAVVVTHDPVDVAALADQVLVIEDGRAEAVCAPAELVESGSLYGRAFGLAAAELASQG